MNGTGAVRVGGGKPALPDIAARDGAAAARRFAVARLGVNGRAFLIFLGLLAALVGTWESLVAAKLLLPIVPGPGKVLAHAYDLLANAFYVRSINDVGIGWQLLHSMRRVLTGFALASAAAVPLGFIIGMSPVAARAIDPFAQMLRPVSPLAWLPIGLAVLRDSERTALFVICISSIWPTLLSTIFAVRNVPRIYLDVAATLQASRAAVVRRILLPAALPGILTGLRISLGISWLVIIAAEMLIGGKGIGYFVWNEWNNLDVANIIVAILLVGGIGLALDRLFGALERKVRYDA